LQIGLLLRNSPFASLQDKQILIDILLDRAPILEFRELKTLLEFAVEELRQGHDLGITPLVVMCAKSDAKNHGGARDPRSRLREKGLRPGPKLHLTSLAEGTDRIDELFKVLLPQSSVTEYERN